MKIWLSKNSEIPVREQLITQITLGIISGDLPIGDKLPSTRELARRFRIHSNTVGSAYRKLSESNLIELKPGSGFYVAEGKSAASEGKIELDALIKDFLKTAQSHGFSLEEIRRRLDEPRASGAPDQIIVIESNRNLREILIAEIANATTRRMRGVSYEDFAANHRAEKAIFAAMTDEKSKIKKYLSADEKCVFLKARSVSGSMLGENRPANEDLIAVVSGWEKFLSLAKTILVAADIESDALMLRLCSETGWRDGLGGASMIICDALSARSFPGDARIKIFRLIADDSMNELENFTGEN